MRQHLRLLRCLAPLVLVTSALPAAEGYSDQIQRTVLLQTSVDAAGQPLRYPQGEPLLTGMLVVIPPGKDTGWHTHPHPCIGHVLEGEITLEVEGGPARTFKAGDTLAEVVNLRHRGRALGDKPVRLLFFSIGERGAPIAIGAEAPAAGAHADP
jgi:quercetin dioxygenase-like cupin family protein